MKDKFTRACYIVASVALLVGTGFQIDRAIMLNRTAAMREKMDWDEFQRQNGCTMVDRFRWKPPAGGRFIEYGPEDEHWMRPAGLGTLEPVFYVVDVPGIPRP